MSKELDQIWASMEKEGASISESLETLHSELQKLNIEETIVDNLFSLACDAITEAEKQGFYDGFTFAKNLLLKN